MLFMLARGPFPHPSIVNDVFFFKQCTRCGLTEHGLCTLRPFFRRFIINLADEIPNDTKKMLYLLVSPALALVPSTAHSPAVARVTVSRHAVHPVCVAKSPEEKALLVASRSATRNHFQWTGNPNPR